MAYLNLNSNTATTKISGRCRSQFNRCRQPSRAGSYPGAMAATTERLASSYRALTERAGVLDRSELGKLALTGTRRPSCSTARSPTTSRRSRPGTGCYATLLTNKGKMLGDLRVLATGDELLLDHRARRAAGALRPDPPRRDRLGRASCTSARCSRRCCSLIGPARPRGRRRRRRAAAPTSTRTPRARSAGVGGRCSSRPTSGVDVVCAAEDTGARARRAGRRGRRRGRRGRRRDRARRVRPPALRDRPRRHDDPPGGRAQRAAP